MTERSDIQPRLRLIWSAINYRDDEFRACVAFILGGVHEYLNRAGDQCGDLAQAKVSSVAMSKILGLTKAFEEDTVYDMAPNLKRQLIEMADRLGFAGEDERLVCYYVRGRAHAINAAEQGAAQQIECDELRTWLVQAAVALGVVPSDVDVAMRAFTKLAWGT